ncbi:MAG: peptidoglycan -binding protein [Paracoccaceae bacterium]
MALARRNSQRFSGSIWPGFVDALTALLLILMFVLSIFMIVQFTLRERITGQDQKLEQLGAQLVQTSGALSESEDQVSQLTNQLAQLSNALGLEQQRGAELQIELGNVRSTLAGERNEVSRLSAALSAMTTARQAADAAVTRLSGELDNSVSEAEALNLALANARTEIDAQAEAARLAAARREALDAMVADLESEKTAQATRLIEMDAAQARTLALLDDLRAQQARAAEEQAARVAALDADKAAALALVETLKAAQAASESDLEKLTSENAEALAALERLTAEQAIALAAIAELETEQEQLTNQNTQQAGSVADLEGKLQVALARAAELETGLTEAEQARLLEVAAAEALREKLEASTAELDATALALEEVRSEAEQTLTLLAAAEAARQSLSKDALAQSDQVDREAALRAIAEQELSKAEAQTRDEQRKVAALNLQVRELNTQLGGLQALLNDAQDRDEAAQVQIAELGSQLNQALARKVSELSRFRSEFFGRMQAVLGNQEGVQVVGDRFVFQSEVLFGSASAVLGVAGKAELAKLADIVREVAVGAPEGLNWILRVDGHTDQVPLSGSGAFRDNWGRSPARALSVVRYLIEVEGIPPGRLAATGFGEYQPIASGTSAAANARNRRIEFKFTER